MNKPAMSAIRKQAQAGFTLIELIVVIVILGILAATALPKFASLGGDARVASLKAAQGALMATATMAHGQWLIDPTREKVTYEGTDVTYATSAKSGYPKANAAFATAAGLNATDYDSYPGEIAATDTAPAAAANSISIVPASVKGTAKAKTCFINYAEPTTANGLPVITVNATADNC